MRSKKLPTLTSHAPDSAKLSRTIGFGTEVLWGEGLNVFFYEKDLTGDPKDDIFDATLTVGGCEHLARQCIAYLRHVDPMAVARLVAAAVMPPAGEAPLDVRTAPPFPTAYEYGGVEVKDEHLVLALEAVPGEGLHLNAWDADAPAEDAVSILNGTLNLRACRLLATVAAWQVAACERAAAT